LGSFLLGKYHWEVFTWENTIGKFSLGNIPLGSFHLGKYHWEVFSWENTIGKLLNLDVFHNYFHNPGLYHVLTSLDATSFVARQRDIKMLWFGTRQANHSKALQPNIMIIMY